MKRFLLPFLILALALWSLKSLLHPGWYVSHDGIFHVRRVSEMIEMLRLGYFPVRWGLTLDNFYGIPLFNFIYPAPYYIAASLTAVGIGVPTALKLATIAAYAAGGLGWYALFRKKSKMLALTAAVIYLLTPYQLVNIFVRGTIGETMALGLIPWVFLAHRDIQKCHRMNWYHPVPLGLTLLAHNFLGLLVFAFFLAENVVIREGRKHVYRSLLVSLGLSAFFVLPMVVERNLLYSQAFNTYSFNYEDHFVYPKQLLYSKWDYWYSMPGTDQDGITFQLGFANIALLALAIIGLLRNRSSRARLYVTTVLIAIFFMVPASKPVWDNLPLLQTMQFPWRLLAVTTVMTPLLLESVYDTNAKKHRQAFRWFALFLVLLAFVNTRNYKRPMRFLEPVEFYELNELYKDKTTTSYRTEIVPKWSQQEKWQSKLATVEDGVSLEIHPDSTQGRIHITTGTENEGQNAVIHKNYFPSWQAIMDGKENVPLEPTDDGSILLLLKKGEHDYTIALIQTPTEKTANTVSALSLFYLGYLVTTARKHEKS